jgi:hypothetical protein
MARLSMIWLLPAWPRVSDEFITDGILDQLRHDAQTTARALTSMSVVVKNANQYSHKADHL